MSANKIGISKEIVITVNLVKINEAYICIFEPLADFSEYLRSDIVK